MRHGREALLTIRLHHSLPHHPCRPAVPLTSAWRGQVRSLKERGYEVWAMETTSRSEVYTAVRFPPTGVRQAAMTNMRRDGWVE